MSIFGVNLDIINKFCGNFKESFSNKQFEVFRLFVYAMLRDYKRLNLSSLAKQLPIDYQTLQYFFSDSRWSYELLNNKRINALRRQRTTGFSKAGILVIDDTGSLKPHAKKTEGVGYQHCPSLKDEAYCNVAVGSCFVSGNKHIPLDLKFYKPEAEFELGKDDDEFNSKIDFAKELVSDALNKSIPFSYVVFDSWYTSNEFLESLELKGLKFVSEIRSNRHLNFKDPVSNSLSSLKQGELVKLIRKNLRHKVRVVRYKGVPYPVYAFRARLKGCPVGLKAFVVFGKWTDEDSKSVHILITNDLKMSHKRIVELYMQRWGIEQLFRELKDTFYFDHYQVRHKEKIMRYWQICILIWSLIFWIKQNAYLYKVINADLSSFNDYKEALNKLILFASYSTLSKNSALYDDYFSDIKSQRFRNTCYA